MEFRLLNKAYKTLHDKNPCPPSQPHLRITPRPASVLSHPQPCAPGRRWFLEDTELVPCGPLRVLFPLLGTASPPHTHLPLVSASHYSGLSANPSLPGKLPLVSMKLNSVPLWSHCPRALWSPTFLTVTIKPTLSSLRAGIVCCVSSCSQSLALSGTQSAPDKSLLNKQMGERRGGGKERQLASGGEVGVARDSGTG